MISSSDLGTGHMSVGNTTSVTSLHKTDSSWLHNAAHERFLSPTGYCSLFTYATTHLQIFLSLLCKLNHWLLYVFPLPYILQHSVRYLLAIGTSLLFQSEMEQYLKWCCNLLLQNYRFDWGWTCYQGPHMVLWPMSYCFISWLVATTPPHQFINI